MKRSVAIIGRTPSFLRWAIWQPCQLRDLDAARLTASTFRQLRSVRELSVARLEQRVFEDICVHPLATSCQTESALGFPAVEVVEMYGGQEAVEKCCQRCPANAAAVQHPGSLAGCYGWLSTDPGFNFEETTRGSEPSRASAIHQAMTDGTPEIPREAFQERVEQAIQVLQIKDRVNQLFLPTEPSWYGLWASPVLTEHQLQVIEKIFRSLLAGFQSEIETGLRPANCLTDLIRFVDAISICQNSLLPLHVDLIPAGESDGVHWSIPQHCSRCKCPEKSELQRVCPACDQHGNEQNATRHRVLGLRPYLHLHSILGEQKTKEFLRRFESQKSGPC